MEANKPDGMPTLAGEQELRIRLDQLKLVNEELQHKKLEAEKDRELFRDLYNKASAHATEVSKENDQLLERATLAEDQLRDGLAMVKGTYEAHVKKLEEDVARWRGLCAVLKEKDRRTGDEVRKRAALEPELREQTRALREELENLRKDYVEAQEQLTRDTEEEQEELEQLSKEAYPVSTPTPVAA